MIVNLIAFSFLSLAIGSMSENPQPRLVDNICTMTDLPSGRLDSSSFNFWLGTWKAVWKNEAGQEEYGQNVITLDFNGKVLHEVFTITEGKQKGFRGESFSVFDKATGQWKQTWIDTDGSYLDFIGSKEGDTLFFSRSFLNKGGKAVKQRMKFYNIKPDSFDWDWEVAEDGGPWTLRWAIDYSRKK